MRSENKEIINTNNFYYRFYLSQGQITRPTLSHPFSAAFFANLQVFEFLSSCKVGTDFFFHPVKYLSSVYNMQSTLLDFVLNHKRKLVRSCPKKKKKSYRTIEGMWHLPRWRRLRWSIIGIQRSFLSFAKEDLERSVEEVALEHLSIGRIWRCVIEGA